MTAVVLPFPVVRRICFIEKQAEVACGLKPAAAVRYIEHQLKVQADAMRRKGVEEVRIAAECVAMAAAVYELLHRWSPGHIGGAM